MGKYEADHEPFPTDKDVDEVIGEFRGDARQAVRALLHDLAVLAADYDAPVSRGYVRGVMPWSTMRKSR
ncbi:hypothetical protein [uncultured Enterovirga sp.]|uniref:hypothetical protein n=1 Tax=uncultured Enterovirga sp. TaxID=2026352 RepID=UPI0035CC2622